MNIFIWICIRKKNKWEYINDELIGLIVPKRQTQEDRRIFHEAIEADKKKNKSALSGKRKEVIMALSRK